MCQKGSKKKQKSAIVGLYNLIQEMEPGIKHGGNLPV
jgi:hypothetical protein